MLSLQRKETESVHIRSGESENKKDNKLKPKNKKHDEQEKNMGYYPEGNHRLSQRDTWSDWRIGDDAVEEVKGVSKCLSSRTTGTFAVDTPHLEKQI